MYIYSHPRSYDDPSSTVSFNRCTIEARQTTGNDQDLFSLRSINTLCMTDNTKFLVDCQSASIEGLKNVCVYYTWNTISFNGMVDWYKTAVTYEELNEYLTGGYYCSLTADINMKSLVDDVSSAIIIPSGVYSLLDLNGHSITVTERNGIKIFGKMDIRDLSESGTGQMIAAGGPYDNGKGNPALLWTSGSGELFIYGGSYHSGTSGQCVYASEGTVIKIKTVCSTMN